MDGHPSSSFPLYRLTSQLFAADLGRNYTRYSPTCEQPPFAPRGCPDLGPLARPREAAWWGVTATQPFNLALVDPASLLAAEQRMESLNCSIRGSPNAIWPHCALQSPATCVRVCASPFASASASSAGPPVVVHAVARTVLTWHMANDSKLEAQAPPSSPACAKPGACGSETVKVLLVPFSSTDLRVGSFPVA